MKDAQQVRDELSARLKKSYLDDVCGVSVSWPHDVALGNPSRQEILAGFAKLDELVRTLKAWERDVGTMTRYRTREAGGRQQVPSHVVVPTIEAAAALATPWDGMSWKRRLKLTRERDARLRQDFPELEPHVRKDVLRRTRGAHELEFALTCEAGAWFRDHDARGLTSRQVPLPGIDGKWLNKTRSATVCLLAGTDDLGLVSQPESVAFAYLDPTHLAVGGRRYDSWVAGDTCLVPYDPSVVLIVENKDTYLSFPEVEGGVCVFGSGFAGISVVSHLPFMAGASHVVYWGDLDADGLAILSGYREAGLACDSILMDSDTLAAYGRFGTNVDHRKGTASIDRRRLELAHLTDAERAAYLTLTDPAYAGNRRLEQEKLPLELARSALLARVVCG